MKQILFLLSALAAPLQAQLYADVSTTMGDFTLEMFYEDSPQTVANFVSLAEGSRKWIDPATGAVKENTPFFDGIIFHRVIKDFMNQVGSPQGTGADGPGYNFPDEVSNGLLHDEPYLLSSANSGPHTNGSQLFITVAVTDWLDGIHTVFGKVSSGTDVIDAINDVAVNGSSRPLEEVSIVSMTIRRVGAAAIAFDVTAQGLPEIEQVQSKVISEPEGLSLGVQHDAGCTLEVFESPDMTTWSSESCHLDHESAPLSEFDLSGEASRAFFRTSLVRWPAEAKFPSDLEPWIIFITDPVSEFEFSINLSEPATLTFKGKDAEEEPFLINMEDSTFHTDGYGCSILLFTTGIEGGAGLVPFRFRLGADLPVASEPAGRMKGTVFGRPSPENPSGQWPLTGGFTLTPNL